MNPKLEPLLRTLEAGCTELAKRTAQLHKRVLEHEAADAEADERMRELRLRAAKRDRNRFPSEPPRGRR
jgi:hypothetical protein